MEKSDAGDFFICAPAAALRLGKIDDFITTFVTQNVAFEFLNQKFGKNLCRLGGCYGIFI
ncbi:MAG: hypothetical protein ACI30L_05950 [Muribaculaceae bacterium]